ncbi:hypothetical protein FDECE_1721 [Fusarium decemcellulare]|nr:hypothetical protein FDECE_1721 [Fusarium decemcellulare]
MALSKELLLGLHWEETTFGTQPRWTSEPSPEAIKLTLQSLWPSKTLNIALFAQGAFNKLYAVSVQDQPPLLLRISLPVDPRYKTLSEIATIRWVSANTAIPVPRIINYDCSRDSAIGFEWILMTKLEGGPLSEVWRHLDFSIKSNLIKEFVSFSACIFNHEFTSIGNIYHSSTSTQDIRIPRIGRIVSMPFFWDRHIHLDINRGPFRSSRDWIEARLSLYESDCISFLDKYPDGTRQDSDAEDEFEDAARTLNIANKLRLLLGRVFPKEALEEESTILWHGDLSMSNILVDSGGKLTGVVDWECVPALPLWKACCYPPFMEGRVREEKPDISRYREESDEQPSELYHEHVVEYELTSLRRLFLEEMEALETRWMSVFNASQLERDFDLAVENCDSEVSARDILEWVDKVNAGTMDDRGLRGLMYGP